MPRHCRRRRRTGLVRAAAENDAQLESCAVEGDDIVVTVSVPLRLPFMSRVSQRSRAGPISCE